MDLSKLPRLSKTDPGDAPEPIKDAAGTPANAPAPAPGSFCSHCGATLRPGARFCDSCGAATPAGVVDYARAPEPGAGADAWISIIIGLLLVFMAPRIWQYMLMRGSFTWTFNDPEGNPLAYPKTVFFWGDIALALFALTLIAEGIIIGFVRRPGVVAAALGLTVVTTLLNLVYVASMMVGGYDFQLMSGLAFGFGVYIAIYEWNLLRSLRALRA